MLCIWYVLDVIDNISKYTVEGNYPNTVGSGYSNVETDDITIYG